MKDAYYFSHDSNARNDTKILSMRCDYGLEGYGMYWIIIEALRDESEYKLKCEDSTFKALAMQMHCKVDAVKIYIEKCIKEYELLNTDGVHIWSDSLNRRMGKLEEIREKRKKAAEKRWNQEDNSEGVQKQSKSNANALQTDAKERKGKERKENISTVVEAYKRKLSLLPQPKNITSKRETHINGRIKEFGIEGVMNVIDKVSCSKFLLGDNERKWKADIDWIFNPNNFTKILEGKYDNKIKEAQQQEGPIGVPHSESVLGKREEPW